MTEILLRRELEPAAQRQQRVALLHRLSRWWLALAVFVVALIILQRFVSFPGEPLVIAVAGVLILAAVGWASRAEEIDYHELAERIATQKPELHALLLAAVEQERDPVTGQLSYLQERVLNDALAELRRQQKLQSVSPAAMARAQALHAFAVLCFLVALLAMPPAPRKSTSTSRSIADARVTVTPGDTAIERGHGLVVLAKFEGPVPAEATLVVTTNGIERRVSLAKNLNDPVFGGSVPDVSVPMKYRVEFGSERTRDFAVSVFEFPRLERADATITYPGYTGLERKEIRDTRRVSAVEGSTLEVTLQLNKPVRTAAFIGRDQSVLPLIVESNRALARLDNFLFATSQVFQVQLVDADGRTNKVAAQFAVDALTNQRPQMKLVMPRGDQRVSPLQEMNFQAELQDDFGLRGWGLSYSLGGEDPKHVSLGGTAGAHVKTNLAHLLKLEDLKVEPDQLISYFIWADDFGPDGQLRRTSSDMFFVEVRPFEEIFREGDSASSQQQQQQQQQQQGGNSPTARLAELQKQIINATWKLQRQETGAKLSEKYLRDEPVVLESQERALTQAEAMDEQLQDLQMKERLQVVQKHMTEALSQLTAATNSATPLPKALASEQAAYQALLKMQAREFQVVQSRQQQGQQQQRAAQPNQSQLSQLDMKRQEDRYETQREAQSQQPQQNKEQLEALNKLKELAQRQQDINERLKDLQTQLQAAQTEKEREELQRELKRLREEQREMLADMDQLKQQMEQPQSQSQMAEQRQQLEQARQEAQRASEALDQPSVPQALAAGTRAERQLQQMRDEMRKQTSGQFSEEMRQMRNDARELAEKQQEIREQMQAQNDKPKSLSDAGEPQQLAEKISGQKQAVTNLLDQMKRVTEKAEVAEPLLSKQLYDSLRRASQSTLDQSLTAAEELSRRNFLREAQQFEQRAGREIDSLKNDVERAAQSVLGDETESLRAAKRELDRLTEALQGELARVGRTNAAVSNALARMTQGGTNAIAGRAGTNGLAAAAGTNGTNSAGIQLASARSGTNGTNVASALAGGTNGNSLAMSAGTNGTARPGGGTNSAGPRELASSQRGNDAQQGGNQPGEQGRGQQQTAQAGQQDQQNPGEQSQQGQQQNGQGRGNNRGDQLAQMFENQQQRNGSRQRQQQGGAQDGGGVLTGNNEFTEWNQRLSNVEEMVDRPALRNEIARVRDRARAARAEFKRHSKEPQWDLVELEILRPLVEVRDRVADELSRRESSESLAPIDRDPVPGKYGDLVRRYYEILGGSQ